MLALAFVLFGQVRTTTAAACDAPTKTWDGGAGSSSWNTAANWSPDGVPTSADDVCIGAGVTIGPSVGAAARTFQVLSSGSLTIVSGSTLNVAGPGPSSIDAGAFLTVEGSLQGSSPLIFAGSMVLSGDSTISVPVTNTATGVITKSSTGTTILSGSLTNAGAVHVDAGTLQLTGTSGSASGSLAIALNAQVTHAGRRVHVRSDGGPQRRGRHPVHRVAGDVRGRHDVRARRVLRLGRLPHPQRRPHRQLRLPERRHDHRARRPDPAPLARGSAATPSSCPAATRATTTISSGAIASISVPTGTLSLGRTLWIAGATTFNGVGTIGSSGGNGTIVNAAAFHDLRRLHRSASRSPTRPPA